MKFFFSLSLIFLSLSSCMEWDYISSPLSPMDRVEGMLLGSLIGDAAGGPWEFSETGPRPKAIELDQTLDYQAIGQLADHFSLSPYLRSASPFGPWDDKAPAGTLTDDSRMKCFLFHSMRENNKLDSRALARSFLSHNPRLEGKKKELAQEWLKEFHFAAKWHLKMEGGLPPERMWGGKPAIVGQMLLLPVAAARPNQLDWTYKKVWELDFFDSGMARDFNAALVTGLAAALQDGADWNSIELAIRETDPFEFGKAEFVQRQVNAWLDFSHEAVRRAEGTPQKLFDILEGELQAETWWECWVPMVVAFSCLELCEYHPMAAMELVLQFGHDTDSYLQLLGAFTGALFGKDIFHSADRERVIHRLDEDYGEKFGDWMNAIGKLRYNY